MILRAGGVALRGRLRVTLRDAKTGLIKADYWNQNKIVDTGLNLVRDLLGNSNFAPTHIAVGTDNTAPVAGDTALGAETFRNAITFVDIDPQEVTFSLFLGAGDANGDTLQEAAIFNHWNTDTGDMLSRVLLIPTIAKDAETTATLTWQITMSRVTASTIPDESLTYIAKLVRNDQVTAPLYMAVGTDDTAWSASDTALVAEVYREFISRTVPTAEAIRYQMNITSSDVSGPTLKEVGIFNAATGGDMLTRIVLPSPIATPGGLPKTLTIDYDIAEA